MKTARCDVAILNATVVDGTGAPEFVCDLEITGDRISHIGVFRGKARETIDAFGKVLAPGFIDLHGHSDYSLMMDPLARSKIFQGVTTEVGGNCGYHAAPVLGALAEERREEYLRTTGLDFDWTTSEQYFDRLTKTRPSINYAQQIGYNSMRAAVAGYRRSALTTDERDQIRAMIRHEFELGAVGLSYGLAYSPACFSTTDELVDAAEETARAGSFLTFHLRSEDAGLEEAIEEAIVIARRSGAALHIAHLKTFRRANWGKLDRVLAMLDETRAAGLEVSVDRYPHLAMNTQLKFLLPAWALEGGGEEMQRRLRDVDASAKIVRELELLDPAEAGEVLISLVTRPENKICEGRRLSEIAGHRNAWVVLCELLATEGDSAFATLFGMSRSNLDRILALDDAIVASDASIQAPDIHAGGGLPHPRCFNTFPLFLAEWVYQRKVQTLPQAIRRITSMPADRAALTGRGRIHEGHFADLVLFDPTQLSPQVSYDDPIRLPTGIEMVIVNGVPAVREASHSGARSGRLLTRGGGTWSQPSF